MANKDYYHYCYHLHLILTKSFLLFERCTTCNEPPLQGKVPHHRKVRCCLGSMFLAETTSQYQQRRQRRQNKNNNVPHQRCIVDVATAIAVRLHHATMPVQRANKWSCLLKGQMELNKRGNIGCTFIYQNIACPTTLLTHNTCASYHASLSS